MVFLNSDIGTKYGTIEIFSDGIGHIIFKWENSNDFSAFLLSKHVKHHLPMSFDENTICEEINNGVFSFDGGNDWKLFYKIMITFDIISPKSDN